MKLKFTVTRLLSVILIQIIILDALLIGFFIIRIAGGTSKKEAKAEIKSMDYKFEDIKRIIGPKERKAVFKLPEPSKMKKDRNNK